MAIVQEMNRQVGCLAQRVHQQAPGGTGTGTGMDGLRRQLRARGVPFYAKCELVQHFPASAFIKSKASFFKKRRRGGDGYGSDDDDDDGSSRYGSSPAAPAGTSTNFVAESLFLKIDNTEAEQSSEYAKEDLWILSTSADFSAPLVHDSGARGNVSLGEKRAMLRATGSATSAASSSEPAFTYIARGVYHGRSSRGMIELKQAVPFFRCVIVPLPVLGVRRRSIHPPLWRCI
jgi:hypothetical protein